MQSCKKIQNLTKTELLKVVGGTGGSGLDPVDEKPKAKSYIAARNSGDSIKGD
ncbi:hypothetical protein L3V43_20700 [Pseudoalteromonas sp. L23]|uniref:hypothetical protein n=1 Tax=unclassified Pseudoalteromonas TaxID=194690 RepID=UPI00148705E0|nr:MULTISPECIES: hypothetical protein [unclassified Pseudoalteromonas]MCF7515955.1 hypothetical protein [Pseudoalteromonas sp. L7]MCF7528073.1 hypothetical protein [Pseudoalteromonas sp. L23]